MPTPIERPYARMRIREDQAKLLYRLVFNERGRMTRERRRWSGMFPTTTFNQILSMLDITKRQIETIAHEEGWDLGEPWEQDPEGPGARTAAGIPQRVGERA